MKRIAVWIVIFSLLGSCGGSVGTEMDAMISHDSFVPSDGAMPSDGEAQQQDADTTGCGIESPPSITAASCTSYERGTHTTCTFNGTCFNPGGDEYIECLDNRQIVSQTSTQVVVEGDWLCNCSLGSKHVAYRNPDELRDDEYNLISTVMGPIFVTAHWPQSVSAGETDVQVGFNGCNFGSSPALFVAGVQLSNVHLQAEDQVLATGTVVGSGVGDKCVAKFAGAPVGDDKWCCTNCITINP